MALGDERHAAMACALWPPSIQIFAPCSIFSSRPAIALQNAALDRFERDSVSRPQLPAAQTASAALFPECASEWWRASTTRVKGAAELLGATAENAQPPIVVRRRDDRPGNDAGLLARNLPDGAEKLGVVETDRSDESGLAGE